MGLVVETKVSVRAPRAAGISGAHPVKLTRQCNGVGGHNTLPNNNRTGARCEQNPGEIRVHYAVTGRGAGPLHVPRLTATRTFRGSTAIPFVPRPPSSSSSSAFPGTDPATDSRR